MPRKPAFVPPYKRERETKAKYEERSEYLHKLHDLLKPGDRIHMVLRHRSASGMYRAIDFYLFECEKGEVTKSWLSYWIASAGVADRWDDKREAVGVTGVGMDMGFHVVYTLSRMLYPNGFRCIGKDCPSNDHANGMPRPHPFPTTYAGNDVNESGPCPVYRCGLPASDHPTKATTHRDGGYALRYEWLG